MTVELEDRIRDVLGRQAEALDVPAWHPAQGAVNARIGVGAAEPALARAAERGHPTGIGAGTTIRRLRARPAPGRAPLWLASAAAAVLVVGGAVAVEQGLLGRSEAVVPGDGATPAEPARPISLATPQVQLDAASITVTVNGRVFRPIGDDVKLNSDPGTASYTTLEVTWFEDGVEMRINLYFAADATHWWVTEMRTYDGRTPGEWITQEGVAYRTPRGQPYEGDLGFGPLRMTGVRLTVTPGP